MVGFTTFLKIARSGNDSVSLEGFDFFKILKKNMKLGLFNIICLFMMCYVNFNAQNYIDIASSNKEKPTTQLQPQDIPMLDWEKHWTKESVIAIKKLIEKYGYPDEAGPNRMYWILPGEIMRTITYTEYFLFNPHLKPIFALKTTNL
jgi:hypothetical protein